MARIRPANLEIADLKTGRMKREHREARLANKQTDEMKKLVNSKSKRFPLTLATDEWHDLKIQIEGNTMTVSIDGKQVGQFESEGIGHPTKNRLRLAVNKSAWVDDVVIHGSK